MSGRQHRAGFVALGGRSNVGKSSLLNRLVGHKVAIVTPKPQTTRRRILGIRTDPAAQIIFIDAPGLHDSPRMLNHRMADVARRAISEGEVVIAVIDAATKLGAEDRSALEEVRTIKAPRIVAVNKIDLIQRDQMLPMLEQLTATTPEAEVVPVSALTGENIEELLRVITAALPESPALMP